MCGIAGIVHPDAGSAEAPQLPDAEIRAMTGAIAHRGPDAEGFFAAPGVALGNRRLKVIDLPGGVQPMSDASGAVWVTYNGEIYNFREVRAELEARGRAFSTAGDTEVLVQGYLEWGEQFVGRLNGMFAFAIWDRREGRLFAARDPMGQKPLYYTRLADGTLLFASELKALVAHSHFRPRVDPEGLAAYLTFEYLPAQLSICDGVRKVPPGHTLTFADGRLQVRQYWDLPFGEEDDSGDAVGRFRALFDRAVARHLIADVPLGVFLSGGIDSSAVAAAATRARPRESVKTFAIGFDEPSYDESKTARLVAEHLGTEHYERIFSVETLREVLPKVTANLDEPFGDASLLPTYLLSAFAREHVTVALGGDGGDELLLGYPTFGAEAFARAYRHLPPWLRRVLRRQADRLPVDPRNFSFDFVVQSFLRGVEYGDAARHPVWLGSVVPGNGTDPLHPDLRREYPLDRVLTPALDAYAAGPERSWRQRLSYQYCKTYLAEDILHKVDRASMAVSLETRSPFLDRELVEFIARLPARWKLRADGTSKVILRRACADRLPATTLARKKKGFGIPLAAWLRGPLSELTDDLLSSERIRSAGYFSPEVVGRLLGEHRRGLRNHRKILWTLLSFELWRDRYAVGARG